MPQQGREVDGPFELDGVKIRYPAQSSGPGSSDIPQSMIWNCRCTLLAWVKGFEGETIKSSPKMGGMSFEEWQQAKEIPDTTANWTQFKEYHRLLGKDAPQHYSDFLVVKYSDKEQWEWLKEQARMERAIRKAPCTLTKRKFTGYFLKPGAKHADEFFDVGYTVDDVRRLRYDMAQLFDIKQALERVVEENGVEKFNLIMYLGVDEKEPFLTGWQIDSPGEKPRIITGFRMKKDDKRIRQS